MQSLMDNSWAFWMQGGLAMGGLFMLALVMYSICFYTRIEFWQKGLVSSAVWKSWIKDTSKSRGHVGKLIVYGMEANTMSLIQTRFNEMRSVEIDPINRNLKFLHVCVRAAPLIGLLGTVAGMLLTFQGLAEGSGGDQTMETIAAGIKEALYTTAMGLMVALPGYFFHFHLQRCRDKYAALIEHLESACLQRFYRNHHSG
ncbi:MAG: MotA/TolQ/ExbB proton channel family protein [Verrucomicrobiota bacterium]